MLFPSETLPQFISSRTKPPKLGEAKPQNSRRILENAVPHKRNGKE